MAKRVYDDRLFLETDLERVKNILAKIDHFRKTSIEERSFLELKENCKIILDIVPFMITYIDNTYITRGRVNEKKIFKTKQEISYNKNFDQIQAGRFNLKGQPVFYGCLPTFNSKDEYINYRNQCPIFEINKGLTNGEGMRFPKFFTIGFWKITKQLSALNLCFNETHLNSNSSISKSVKSFSERLKSVYPIPIFELIQSVWQYFSSLSCSWNETTYKNDYHILTALFAAFNDTYGEMHQKPCNGIIYPSAMTQAKGLNIVLDTETVEKHLQLEFVQVDILKSRSLQHDYLSLTEQVSVMNDKYSFDSEFMLNYNMAMNNWEDIDPAFFKDYMARAKS